MIKNRKPLDEDEYRSYELKSDETKVSARSLMKGQDLQMRKFTDPLSVSVTPTLIFFLVIQILTKQVRQ